MQIEENKYYRTNDGQKMGPMMPRKDREGYVWEHRWDGTQARIFTDSGVSYTYSGLNLVAEWQDPAPASPVRRRTVTEVTIVPGKYGDVRVGKSTIAGVYAALGDAAEFEVLTASELRAAAATLTDLAAALEEQQNG